MKTMLFGATALAALLSSQAELKESADPKGLMNPGKLRAARTPPAFAPALPRFLFG